jgi:hypothetical protein
LNRKFEFSKGHARELCDLGFRVAALLSTSRLGLLGIVALMLLCTRLHLVLRRCRSA